MTVAFAAAEAEAFTASSANVIESTTVGQFDASYARCGIRLGLSGVGENILTPVFTSLTTAWVHWEWRYNTTSGMSGLTMQTLYNSSGTAVFRLQFTATSVLQMQYWNGSAWTNIGSTTTLTASVLYTFDLNVVCGASGAAQFFIGGVSTLSGSASMTSVTNIAQLQFTRVTTSGTGAEQSWVSQIIVDDVSTVGCKYFSKPPTGNSGTNTAFTGAFGDVDETVLSQADFIESTSANDVETFTGAAITLGSGTVRAVTVTGQAKVAATGPQNMQFALRRSSTNYFGSNVTGLAAGYKPFCGVFTTDPSTTNPWVAADAAAAATEFGVKSIT